MFTWKVYDGHSSASAPRVFETLAECVTDAVRNIDYTGESVSIRHCNEDNVWVTVDEWHFHHRLIDCGEYETCTQSPFFTEIPYHLTLRGRQDRLKDWTPDLIEYKSLVK